MAVTGPLEATSHTSDGRFGSGWCEGRLASGGGCRAAAGETPCTRAPAPRRTMSGSPADVGRAAHRAPACTASMLRWSWPAPDLRCRCRGGSQRRRRQADAFCLEPKIPDARRDRRSILRPLPADPRSRRAADRQRRIPSPPRAPLGDPLLPHARWRKLRCPHGCCLAPDTDPPVAEW